MKKRSKAIGWLVLVLVALVIGGSGCESSSDDVTGGETHFLRGCVPDGDPCGKALSCLCGVCTLPCVEHSSCAAYPAAQCTLLNVGTCAGQPEMVCRVACSADTDCAVLSSEHRCVNGSCLAGVEPPAGSGGTPNEPSGSGGSAGAPSLCEKGLISANDVLILGDSFLATSHQITAFLEELARANSVLGAGDRYRDSSRLVNNALGSGEGIANQYVSSAEERPVKVAIMNGGGADVLIASCDEPSVDCPPLVQAAASFSSLLQTMADDGVMDVVFLGYPDPLPEATRRKMDALRPLLQAACEQSPVTCHWVDLREVFAGHYEDYVLSDGLNPSREGAEAAAQAVWSVMQEECIAQ